MALVLIGFMGRASPRSLPVWPSGGGRTPIDSDTLLAERFGHSVAREFELRGERSFRAAEEELVCRVLSAAARAT